VSNNPLKFFQKRKPQPNTLDMTGIIRRLIGLEVSVRSSWLEDEDVSKFTTLHQAIAMQHATQPIKTKQVERTRGNRK
jgi:hypothetical protein